MVWSSLSAEVTANQDEISQGLQKCEHLGGVFLVVGLRCQEDVGAPDGAVPVPGQVAAAPLLVLAALPQPLRIL